MPDLKPIEISKLSLDLNNYRTRPQKDEMNAVMAMITVKSERFWAILKSIAESGYIPTESIIVLKQSDKLIVKEGNRRVAAIKIILKKIVLPHETIPKNINELIENIPKETLKNIEKIPCLIFNANETKEVERIVARTHGKNEMASRDGWTSVATARHNRDANHKAEPALDVLEHFLEISPLISGLQKESWSGDYPITVLHELIRKLSLELKLEKISEVSELYISDKIPLPFNNLIFEIGQRAIGFNELRSIEDWNTIKETLGLNDPEDDSTESGKTSSTNNKSTKSKKPKPSKQSKSTSITDPKYIPSALRKLVIYGDGREKIVTLKEEAAKLNLEKHPFSFCFTIRSLLELSVRSYCFDNKIPLTKTSKNSNKRVEKKLIELIKDAQRNIINNLPDDDQKKSIVKDLHGAFAELNTKESFLSVTSLNQLIHSATLMTSSTHISTVFANLIPILKHLNAPTN